MSYYDTGTAAWISGTPETSQGPTVFQLGASGLYASVADSTNNVAADTYTTTSLGTADATNPALISYVVAPAPDTAGSTPAYSTTPVYSMKDANPNVSGFALPDGVTADIAANSANNVTDNYTFRIPPRFTLRDGVEVSIAPDANNIVKDAYTFTMPPNTLHTAADLTAGPDLDWLSDKGLANLSTAHDQILSALVTVGTKESSNDMTANLLDTSSTNLNAVLATNDDIDMSKAIIDMKTAENVYQAALSFGARVMPTSLVDFLK